MRTILFLYLLLIIFPRLSYSQTKEELNRTIKSLLTEQKLSGAVWTTISDKGEIITDAIGYKNNKTKELLNPTDKVHVGSVSKTILSAGFLRMATLGLINLDDPINNYLPNLQIENHWNVTNPITIRHLLDHTSGLTDAKLWHIFSTTARPDTPLESILNLSNKLKAQTKPGSVHSYSNLGYTILGMVIEKITHKRYEDYLDETLLKPLGMTNSSFQFITQVGVNADKQLAMGHFDDGEPVFAMPTYLRPAGQITTTADDMGIFLRFMMSDGTIDGKPFIKSEYLKAVGKQELTEAYKNGVPHGFALGANSRDRYGVVGIAKNGNILGFTSMIYMFPNHKKAFFIAYNMDSETANYDLFNGVLAMHLGLTTKNYISKHQSTNKEIANWNGYYVPVITMVEPFGLIDYVFSHTKVETLKNGAELIPFQGKNKTLIYQGKNLFSMKDRTNISHTFYKSDNGELLITDGIKTIKKINGFKIIGISTSILFGLLGLIYLFISGIIQLIKHKSDFKTHSIFWVFVSIVIVFISFVFIAMQPFMRMGDMTIGNILLAVGSLLIPILSIVSLVSIIKSTKKFLNTFSYWAILFVIQFSVLLIVSKIMPIIMWK